MEVCAVQYVNKWPLKGLNIEVSTLMMTLYIFNTEKGRVNWKNSKGFHIMKGQEFKNNQRKLKWSNAIWCIGQKIPNVSYTMPIFEMRVILRNENLHYNGKVKKIRLTILKGSQKSGDI